MRAELTGRPLAPCVCVFEVSRVEKKESVFVKREIEVEGARKSSEEGGKPPSLSEIETFPTEEEEEVQPAVIARSDILPSGNTGRRGREEDLDFGIILAQGEDGRRRRGSSVPRLEQPLLGPSDMKEEGDED